MLTVACVFSGGRYDESWVNKLRAGVERNLHVPHDFVSIPLVHDWPGWWAKIELFRPGLFSGPVLYLDLDCLVCGDLGLLVDDRPGITMWRETVRKNANSSVMYWNGDMSGIYKKFMSDTARIMNEYDSNEAGDFSKFGDQAFIAEYASPISYWQDLYSPDWFHEFSHDGRPTLDPASSDVKLSVCLGEPKFDRYPDMTIVKRNWRV